MCVAIYMRPSNVVLKSNTVAESAPIGIVVNVSLKIHF